MRRRRRPPRSESRIIATLSSWIDHLVLTLSTADVVCVIGAMLIMRASRYAGMWIYALIALPGTAAHELAHFIVGFVLGARPSFPSLVPTRTEHGWRLGSVAVRAGYARALPIALAPLLLAPLALWWALSFLHPSAWPMRALHVWIVAALLTASLPSETDLKLALPALGVVGLIAAIVWAITHFG